MVTVFLAALAAVLACVLLFVTLRGKKDSVDGEKWVRLQSDNEHLSVENAECKRKIHA